MKTGYLKLSNNEKAYRIEIEDEIDLAGDFIKFNRVRKNGDIEELFVARAEIETIIIPKQ